MSLPSCFFSEAWNLHNTYHFVSIEKRTSLVWFDFCKRPSSRLEQLKDSQELMPSLTYTLFPWFGFGLFVCLCVTITIHLAKHHLPPFRRTFTFVFISSFVCFKFYRSDFVYLLFLERVNFLCFVKAHVVFNLCYQIHFSSH